MPLSSAGNKILTAMVQQYGKKKGQSVFYAKANQQSAKGRKFKKLIGRAGKKA